VSSSSTHSPLNNVTPPPSQADARTSPLESMLANLRVRQRRPGSMFVANVGSALEALWANRTRSFLTALGIFIGVASVIGALTLTQGADAYINNEIASLGTTIFVTGGTASDKFGVVQGGGSLSTLTPGDVRSLANVSHVSGISPLISTGEQVVYGRQNWSTQIQGVNAGYQSIQNLQLAQGTWFSGMDDTNGSTVAVIGDTVAHNLFGPSGSNPIGQHIRIRDQIFRVVGVLTVQRGGFTSDDVIYIPLKAAQVRLKNTTTVDQIFVRADAIANVDQAAQAITSILRQNHHLGSHRDNDFHVQTFTQFLQRAGQGDQVLTFLLVGIAAISLTVGGIGIMNIMLVSVTERTWEIGIRMSIGARRRDIRNQFLIEALLLCLIGGIIGLLLGLLIGWALTNGFGLPFVVTAVTLVLPFAVSAAIAIAFGLYPAIRASRLDPIVALRTEE
jgi:putative ABC transport system permease protein